MKIHGTAKGGALSTKDFGVAFGGGADPVDSCDLFDESTATRNEGLDQVLVGFKSNITPSSVSKLTMNMFRQGTPTSDHVINLKHYESATLIATYAPVDNVTTTEIVEGVEATGLPNTKVEWLISPSISLTTNSRLVIDKTGTGGNRLKGLARDYDSGLSLYTTYGTPSSWTESTSYTWIGCLSS